MRLDQLVENLLLEAGLAQRFSEPLLGQLPVGAAVEVLKDDWHLLLPSQIIYASAYTSRSTWETSMRTRSRALIAALSVVLIVFVLAGAYVVRRGYLPELRERLGEQGPSAQVVDLRDIDQLKVAFNQDAGTP